MSFTSSARSTRRDGQSAERAWAPGGRHRTRTEVAYEALREGILVGDLKAGERLSVEDLASALNMSKMPVREAMRALESVGLVESTPYRGSRVTELSIEDLRGVYQVRLAIEPAAVQDAAPRFSRADETAARAHLERLNSESDSRSREAWAAHTDFHFTLYDVAGSSWFSRLIRPLWETSERYRFATAIEPASRESRADHERILQACAARDSDRAARALREHLVRTANAIAESMGNEPVFPSSGARTPR